MRPKTSNIHKYYFSSPVTIQDRNGQCCSQANQWPASRDAHMATCWFLWFWLRACGTHAPDFWTLPIQCKCHTMMDWSQFITFASSWVHWLGSLWINAFKQSSSNPKGLERGLSLMSKWSFLKWPFSCSALSDGIVPMRSTNDFGCLCSFYPFIELKEKNMSEMFQFLHLALHFLVSTAPLTIFN